MQQARGTISILFIIRIEDSQLEENRGNPFLRFINNQYNSFVGKMIIRRLILDVLAILYIPVIMRTWGDDIGLTADGSMNLIGVIVLLAIYLPWAYLRGIEAIYMKKQRRDEVESSIKLYNLFINNVIGDFNDLNFKKFNDYIQQSKSKSNYIEFINSFKPQDAFDKLCSCMQTFIMNMLGVTHPYNVQVGLLFYNKEIQSWDWTVGIEHALPGAELNKQGSAFFHTLNNSSDLFIESKKEAHSNNRYKLDASDNWVINKFGELRGTIVYKKIQNTHKGVLIYEYMLVINTYDVEIRYNNSLDVNTIFPRRILDLVSKQILIFANINLANNQFNKKL